MAPAAPQTPTSPFPSHNTVQPSSLSRLTLSDKLLLSQAVHHIGTTPPDWGRVSSILLGHPLIKTKSRLEQAAKAGITLGRVFGSRECERAWVALMRQYNLVLQPGERDTSIESEPEAGSPALANRSKEARGLPAKTDRGSQLALAQFLYAERIRELQDTIRAKEAAFKAIVSEIEALNSGSLDEKLLAELERSGQLREEAAAAEEEAAQDAMKEIPMGDMTPTPSQSTPGKSAAVSRAASVSSMPDASPSKTAAKKDLTDGATVMGADDEPAANDAGETTGGVEGLETSTSGPGTLDAAVDDGATEQQAETSQEAAMAPTDQAEKAEDDDDATRSDVPHPLVEAPKEKQSPATTTVDESARAALPRDELQAGQEVEDQVSAEDHANRATPSAQQGKRKRAKDGVDSGPEDGANDEAAAPRKKSKSAEADKDRQIGDASESAEEQPGQEAAAASVEVAISPDETEEDVGDDAAMQDAEEMTEEDANHRGDGEMDVDQSEEGGIEKAGKSQPESVAEEEEDADVEEEESKPSKRPEPRRSRRSGKVPTAADDAPPSPSENALAHVGTSASGAKNNRVEALRSREASGTSAETDEERVAHRDGGDDSGEVDGDASHSRTSLSPVSARRGRGRPRRSGRGGSVGGGGTVDEGATGSDTERERVAQVAKQRKMEKVLLMLLNEVSNHTHGNLFHAPIKETDAPDYYTLIRHPLDLKTIKARIKDGRITTATQLRRALMQMFANSLIYNRPGSEIHRMALEMRDAAEEMLDRFEQTQMSANASRR